MPEAPLKNIREGQVVDAVVQRLGAQGDGIAMAENKLLYVPLTLPGEKIKVKLGKPMGDSYAAQLVEITTPSSERVQPPCPHFSHCGGCSLQHLASTPYKAHKRSVILGALRQHHLDDIEVREPLVVPAATRRRLTMAAVHTKGADFIGFNARASHTVINIETCSIARPELVALLPKLRTALAHWLSKAKSLDLTMTVTPSGIDLLITGAEPDLESRETISVLGNIQNLARISWRANDRQPAEPMLQQRQPMVSFGGIGVPFPAGGFLQASLQGEAMLIQLVKGAVRDVTGDIADLFCGLGTFALPLSEQAEVLAVESDRNAVAALKSAVAQYPKVKVESRDLFREPLNVDELNQFGAVVFDPPRAGAQAQVAELAKSDVPVIVAVSCNPGTFARDAEVLVNGGYVCEWVQPVDQFIWSSHIELVARFSKKA